MVRSAMPNSADANRYNYVFDPMPMDEPPIDADTFNHYFHKPHLANLCAVWIERFPQLHGASLFYSTDRPPSWGFEIVEERNWFIFATLNVVGLLLSGLIAFLSAWFLKDNPTGVAIGAWLSAVQTLVVTVLFWHWTN